MASGEGASAAAGEPHEHTASTQPGVDAGSGKLVHHCAQCGTLIEGSTEYCQVCALEVSGGEAPAQGTPPEAPPPGDETPSA